MNGAGEMLELVRRVGPVVRVGDAAHLVGVSRQRVWQLLDRRALVAHRIGGAVWVELQSLALRRGLDVSASSQADWGRAESPR